MIPVEVKSEVHDVPSPAILKIAFIEGLLTTSNAAYKSVRRSIRKRETGVSFSHGSTILVWKETQTLFYILLIYRLIQQL